MDSQSLQTIKDYLMNNDASVNVQSFLGDDGIEYEGHILKTQYDLEKYDELICQAYSLLSFEDVLRQLSIELANASS